MKWYSRFQCFELSNVIGCYSNVIRSVARVEEGGGKEGTYARHLSLYLPLTAAFDIDLNHTCTEHLRSELRFEDPPA